MPGIRAITGALAVAACAAALAACGGDDEAGSIPEDQGNQLLGLLDQIDSLVEEGRCDEAQAAAVEFGGQVNQLPSAVDGELRNALVEASARLETLTEDQCDEPEIGPSDDAEVVPTEPEPTDTTTTTTDTTEEPPDDDDDGQGGNGPPADTPGNGNPGGGNSGGGGGGGDDSSGGIGSDG